MAERIQRIRFDAMRRPIPNKIRIGYETDNMAERLVFMLPMLAQDQSAFFMRSGDDADIGIIKRENDQWYIDMGVDLIGAEGVVPCHVRIDTPAGKVWNSGSFQMIVGDVGDVEANVEKKYPSAVGEMLGAIAEHRAEMDKLNERLDGVDEDVEAANSSAETAVNNANIAQAAASSAGDSAAGAAESAGTAAEKADEAVNKAGIAQAAAGAAVSSAQTAQQAANAAEGAAEEAKKTLDNIPEDYTELSEEVGKLSKEIEGIANLTELKKSANILDKSKLGRGLLNYRGEFAADEAADYFCTDYIRVVPGQYIHAVAGNNDGTYEERDIQRISQFSADKVFTENVKAKAYLVPAGVEYVRLQLHKSLFATVRTMVAITDSADMPPFEFYYDSYTKFPGVNTVVTIDAADGLDAYFDKMLFAFSAGDCDVYIGGGDIVYTDEFVDKIRADGMRGVPIGGNCRYYFDTGTRVICEYTGVNAADVVAFFTPLDSWNMASSYEIHNLDLAAKNVVYALHDEANGDEAFCRHVYKDCNISLDNTALGDNGNDISKCIGGGFGLHSEIIIEDCVFSTVNPLAPRLEDVSYHKANNRDYTDAKVVVTGCWFGGELRFDTNYDPVPVIVPRVLATGNSALRISAAQCDAKIWGNEIRSE